MARLWLELFFINVFLRSISMNWFLMYFAATVFGTGYEAINLRDSIVRDKIIQTSFESTHPFLYALATDVLNESLVESEGQVSLSLYSGNDFCVAFSDKGKNYILISLADAHYFEEALATQETSEETRQAYKNVLSFYIGRELNVLQSNDRLTRKLLVAVPCAGGALAWAVTKKYAQGYEGYVGAATLVCLNGFKVAIVSRNAKRADLASSQNPDVLRRGAQSLEYVNAANPALEFARMQNFPATPVRVAYLRARALELEAAQAGTADAEEVTA